MTSKPGLLTWAVTSILNICIAGVFFWFIGDPTPWQAQLLFLVLHAVYFWGFVFVSDRRGVSGQSGQ